MGILLVRTIGFALLVSVIPGAISRGGQDRPIDLARAKRYFDEAKTLCEADGGRLWGVSLCGPLLFADPRTRTVVANQRDGEGLLKEDQGVFVGTLPSNVNIAYTAVEWAGVKWTMILWPLPDDTFERGRLYAHESWHRIQDQLGLPSAGPSNAHLDTLEGRFWLQLEWRALKAALTDRGPQRRRATEDALTFRAVRRSLFPDADAEESALEMHEGLAQYTGVRLSGHPNPAALAVKLLEEGAKTETFVRSFAYASGPAYGLLLDEARPDWRKRLKPSDDFGRLLAPAFYSNRTLPSKERGEVAALRYGGPDLRASETERDSVRRKRNAEMLARFVTGPVLRIPLRQMRMQFDPSQVQPLEGHGNVYPQIRIVDVWGILNASKGALISSGFDYVIVPAPTDTNGPSGDGWQIELKEGWALSPGERTGDYTLTKKE